MTGGGSLSGESFTRIVRFNRPAIEDIHTDHILDVSLDGWGEATSPYVQSEMAKYLLAVTDDPAPEVFHNSFVTAQQRLALLEGDELVRLALLTGLTLYAGRVCKVVQQQQVIELIETFGRDALVCTHRKLRFLSGKSAELMTSEPAFQRLTAMLPAPDDEQYAATLCNAVNAAGIGIITVFLRMHPEDVYHRIAIRLPQLWKEAVSGDADESSDLYVQMVRQAGALELSEQQVRRCWGMLIRIMKQEMSHVWQNLFV
ncbi:SctK family type III secretion system sorting platform protein [Halodesulfovibrio spirochaetisodalis]|uniref:Uncharacterized protein n=1 Tax=Halodesulfovibrio spirochaetisodalis TaxID=1560234 RepID=A0A1B7X9H8_9BACT|nr:SctK family type III secretion system sorting platform protein [Halodesulfovibrio spirochaetisodalis]OBQ45950.1 hypothetical protein SP90_15140 [Halodesulfovibrio spirochaetisodalis]